MSFLTLLFTVIALVGVVPMVVIEMRTRNVSPTTGSPTTTTSSPTTSSIAPYNLSLVEGDVIGGEYVSNIFGLSGDGGTLCMVIEPDDILDDTVQIYTRSIDGFSYSATVERLPLGSYDPEDPYSEGSRLRARIQMCRLNYLGTRLVVSGDPTDSVGGGVYVWDYNGTDWVLATTGFDGFDYNTDYFEGYLVACDLNCDTVAVTGRNKDDERSLRIFKTIEQGVWQLEIRDIVDSTGDTRSTTTLVMDEAGAMLFAVCMECNNTGYISVISRDSEGLWAAMGDPIRPPELGGDNFGASFAVDKETGTKMVVASRYATSLFYYTRNDSVWTRYSDTYDTPCAIHGYRNQFIMASDGSRLLVMCDQIEDDVDFIGTMVQGGGWVDDNTRVELPSNYYLIAEIAGSTNLRDVFGVAEYTPDEYTNVIQPVFLSSS